MRLTAIVCCLLAGAIHDARSEERASADVPEEISLRIEDAYEAVLGVESVELALMPARQAEPLAESRRAPSFRPVVASRPAADRSALDLIGDGTDWPSGALRDGRSAFVAGDPAAWRGVVSALVGAGDPPDDEATTPRLAEMPARVRQALAVWISHRRIARDSALDVLDRASAGADGRPRDQARVQFANGAYWDVSSWLRLTVLLEFSAGVRSAAESSAALRRLASVGRPEAEWERRHVARTEELADRLGREENAVSSAGKPVADALLFGDFGSRRAANPTVFPDLDRHAPPPIGDLVGAPAAERWRSVPALMELIVSRRPVRFLPRRLAHPDLVRVQSLGEMADLLLAEVTRGLAERPVPGPATGFRIWPERDPAFAVAGRWWAEVQADGLPTYLSNRVARGDPVAAEELAALTGRVDRADLTAALAACEPRHQARLLFVGLRHGDEAAVRECRALAHDLPELGGLRVTTALAVLGDSYASAALQRNWDASRARDAVTRRVAVASLPDLISAAVTCEADALGNWDEAVNGMPRSVRALIIDALPEPSCVRSATLRGRVLRLLVSALADEGDDFAASWIPRGSSGPWFGSAHGSRICDLAATRLRRTFAGAVGFSVLQPVERRDAAIRQMRAEAAHRGFFPLGRPGTAVTVDRSGRVGRSAPHAAHATDWERAARAAALDPSALPGLVSAILGPRGRDRVASVTARWRRTRANEPAEFLCSIQEYDSADGGHEVADRFLAVAELPDGGHVLRRRGWNAEGGFRATWEVESPRLVAQLERNRLRDGESSLRIAVTTRDAWSDAPGSPGDERGR